jgi:hypothetical protein
MPDFCAAGKAPADSRDNQFRGRMATTTAANMPQATIVKLGGNEPDLFVILVQVEVSGMAADSSSDGCIRDMEPQ